MYLAIPLIRGIQKRNKIYVKFDPNNLLTSRSKRTTTATRKPVKGQTSARPSVGGKKVETSKQKNNSSSHLRTGTANKRATTNGVSTPGNPSDDVKEEFPKVKEEPEEEKKFEAGNHMEVDLVDMLGNER